jgi:hypothetical protein
MATETELATYRSRCDTIRLLRNAVSRLQTSVHGKQSEEIDAKLIKALNLLTELNLDFKLSE